MEGFTSITRLASTGMTGGFGNAIISTIEALSAIVFQFGSTDDQRSKQAPSVEEGVIFD